MIKTGVAAAIWSRSSSALSTAETDAPIPNEWLIIDGTNNVAFNPDTIADLKRAGVYGINYNQVGLTSDALRYETITLEAIDAFPNDLVLARTAADFRAARKAGKIATLIGWQSADPVAGEPGYSNPWMTNPPHSELRAHYEIGLRICGISYNTPNLFGGGCLARRRHSHAMAACSSNNSINCAFSSIHAMQENRRPWMRLPCRKAFRSSVRTQASRRSMTIHVI